MALYGFLVRRLSEHEYQLGVHVTVHNRCSDCGHMMGVSLRLVFYNRLFRIDMFFGETDARFLRHLGLLPEIKDE